MHFQELAYKEVGMYLCLGGKNHVALVNGLMQEHPTIPKQHWFVFNKTPTSSRLKNDLKYSISHQSTVIILIIGDGK